MERYGLPAQLREGCVLFIPGVVNGTTAYDASGNSNHGTLVNSPTKTRGGLWGYEGLKFNGTNQYVNLGNPSSLNLFGEISIMTKIKVNPGSNYERIVSKYFTNLSSYAGFQCQVTNTGVLEAEVNNTSSGSTPYFVNGTKNLKDSMWHSVGFSWKPGEQIKLYVDGVSEMVSSSSGTPPSSISTTTNPALIGALIYDGVQYYGNLQLANMAIFNTSLSPNHFMLYNQAFFTP